jgi:RHS repeat-associated protein
MSGNYLAIVVSGLRSLCVAALALCVQVPAHAQASPRTEMALDWRERNAPNGQLKSYDATLLGDAIDLSSGRLSFEQVDVSLPGNSSLPVEIRRRLNPSQMQSGEFLDWQIAIPTISTKILDDEWFANRRWGKIRCSSTVVSPIPNASWPTHFQNGAALPPEKWNDGVILDVPGRVQTQVLDKSVSSAWPAAAKKVTTEGWYLECLTNIDGAGTEGFVAVAPNGDRYTFNVLMEPGTKKSEFDIWQLDPNYTDSRAVNWTKMGVHYDILAVSRVVDVNGNSVDYSYDSNRRLQSITSNDGRRIDIGRTGNLIGSVTANPTTVPRQWTYTYGSKNVSTWKPPINVDGPGGGVQTESWGTLTAVTLPDGRQWQFDLGNLQARAVPGTNYTGTVCKQFPQAVTVTHPDGVTGTFLLEEVMLHLGAGATGSSGAPCPNSGQGAPGSSQATDVMAVTQKTLSSPSMTSAIWDYSYVSDGSQIFTTIQQPDSSKRIEYNPTPYAFASPRAHARLTKEELYPTMASRTPLEVRTYSYIQESAAGSNFITNSVQDTYRPVRLSDTVITRGLDIYNTHSVFNTDRTSAGYSYGFPTQVQEWSSLGSGTRTTDITYANDMDDWVLGLQDTVTKNGTIFDDFGYDTKGRVLTRYRVGTGVESYSYYLTGIQAGLINTRTDALGRVTTFSGWKRGTPGTVTRNDSKTLGRVIDDNGWITSITDWNGVTTGYGYNSPNSMGRLTLIDRPAPWSDTTITYSYSGGSLTQTFTRGTEQDSTTYDAMLRPTQTLREALSGGGGSIYTSATYDEMGRQTFSSLPSATAGSSIGMATSYDALGRVTQRRETASGGSTHNFTYPAGNKTTDTDQDSLVITSTSSGFGSPSDGDVTSIVAPEGVSVTKSHDIYGTLTGMSQAKGDGTFVNTTFAYDTQLRMCRKSLPETGDVLYTYDIGGELTSYAEGQPTAAGCAAPPIGASVVLTYDSIGRLSTTDYPNSTPDISRTYDGNSNLLTLNRGGVNWTYKYNTADLLDVETLSLDALNYRVFNTYDADERVTQKILPSGRTYTYTNDGLGRITGIQGSGNTYVSNVSWHPNGKIKQLTQGNGNVFDQQLNTRQLTSSLGSTYGDDFTYLYDASGRVTTIDAAANNAYDRTLTYDGVGRLKTASGPWGAGSFNYDALGNLKNKTLGSRAVDIAYDSLNHVSQVRDTAVSSSWRSYSYDTRGNVTADGIHTFTHDDSNQPTSITGSGGGTYTYDGNLRRAKTVSGGATTYTFYDGAGNLMGRNNRTTSKKTDYLSVGGQTFVRVTNGVATYPINDHLGTALWVASQSGVISTSQTYNYNPSGETISGSGAGHLDEQGYTAHVEDATNLTYMQARFYDPVIGRFLEVDPTGYTDHLNLYAYVANDPLSRIDPDGKRDIYIGGAADKNRTRIVQDYKASQVRLHPGRDVRYFSYREKKSIAAAINAPRTEGEPLNVIGHSLGGREALRQANHTDAKITNLITVDPVGSAGDGTKPSSVQSWTNVHADPSDRNRSDTVASVGRALFGTTATSGADSNQTVTDSHGDFPSMMSETGSQKKVDDSYTEPKVGP